MDEVTVKRFLSRAGLTTLAQSTWRGAMAESILLPSMLRNRLAEEAPTAASKAVTKVAFIYAA